MNHFVDQGGIAIVVSEALSEGVLASTLLYICEILRLFARTHFSALFRVKLLHAITAMLTFRTPTGADERHMDIEVKHATLMLAHTLHSEGEPREVLDYSFLFHVCSYTELPVGCISPHQCLLAFPLLPLAYLRMKCSDLC